MPVLQAGGSKSSPGFEIRNRALNSLGLIDQRLLQKAVAVVDTAHEFLGALFRMP